MNVNADNIAASFTRWSTKNLLKNNKSQAQNNFFRERFIFYRTIATSRFTWEGEPIPDLETSEQIERMFFEADFIGSWHSEQLDMPIITPIQMKANVNFLNLPLPDKPILYGNDIVYNGEEITWVEGDMLINRIALYCEKMLDIQLAKDQQIFNQRSPIVGIAVDDIKNYKNKLTVKIIDDDIKVLLAQNDIFDKLQALNLGGQFNLDALDAAQTVYENKILTMLGIDVNYPKAERKIVDEQESNDELLGTIMEDCMRRREHIAKPHGFNVDTIEIKRIKEAIQNVPEYEQSSTDV